MELLPETRAALAELAVLLEQSSDTDGQLQAIGQVAGGLVPSCTGVSLTVVITGEPFTLTATTPEVALVDAGQYLDDSGPCLAAAEAGDPVAVPDVLNEEQWQAFGLSSAAVGVRSSLSLSLRDDEGHVTGALNMYASDPHGFDGREVILAALFSATASEVVKNADPSFRTRDWARETPGRLQTLLTVETL